ncbi:hypothetical protein Pmani_035543 [Petrolisthes manimaculis]|uniref:Uncharacterized protein n=1 Tax=Petrolisthes manimaculis TaxID=1843537 RepID=A0AAE1TQE4_9EUCA|nr:hypothetical protein Pmani_035543 [Petrolisthes manimaculis]
MRVGGWVSCCPSCHPSNYPHQQLLQVQSSSFCRPAPPRPETLMQDSSEKHETKFRIHVQHQSISIKTTPPPST